MFEEGDRLPYRPPEHVWSKMPWTAQKAWKKRYRDALRIQTMEKLGKDKNKPLRTTKRTGEYREGDEPRINKNIRHGRRAREIADYIESEPHLTLEEIAKHFGIQPDSIKRCLHKAKMDDIVTEVINR